MKIKKRLIYSKWAFNFLSDWCKNAIKGFDVLKYWAEQRLLLEKKATRNKKLFLAKSLLSVSF